MEASQEGYSKFYGFIVNIFAVFEQVVVAYNSLIPSP
jgi:hypothetical protein